MQIKCLLYLFLCYCVTAAHGDVQCLDENNNPVDWYVVYKFPKFKSSADPLLKGGNGYMYITSSDLESGWQISRNTIDSNSTLFSHSLPFLKEESQKIFSLVYNDQGETTCNTCGHTKGIVAGDENGGIWLVHSIPHYINGTYPSTGHTYGQSALCLSLPKNQLDSVGDLLAYNSPNFQKSSVNDVLKNYYPKIMAAYNGVKVSSPWSLEKPITTAGGTQFHAFAKAQKFNRDLYEWVASSFQTDLYAETWINDEHTLPSSCNLKYRVMNVASILIPKLNVIFSSHKDHSKLAISVSDKYPWVCVGDINRAESQELRGGGTVCLNNTSLWNAYSILIKSANDCKSYNEYTVYPQPSDEIEFHLKVEQI